MPLVVGRQPSVPAAAAAILVGLIGATSPSSLYERWFAKGMGVIWRLGRPAREISNDFKVTREATAIPRGPNRLPIRVIPGAY